MLRRISKATYRERKETNFSTTSGGIDIACREEVTEDNRMSSNPPWIGGKSRPEELHLIPRIGSGQRAI